MKKYPTVGLTTAVMTSSVQVNDMLPPISHDPLLVYSSSTSSVAVEIASSTVPSGFVPSPGTAASPGGVVSAAGESPPDGVPSSGGGVSWANATCASTTPSRAKKQKERIERVSSRAIRMAWVIGTRREGATVKAVADSEPP